MTIQSNGKLGKKTNRNFFFFSSQLVHEIKKLEKYLIEIASHNLNFYWCNVKMKKVQPGPNELKFNGFQLDDDKNQLENDNSVERQTLFIIIFFFSSQLVMKQRNWKNV